MSLSQRLLADGGKRPLAWCVTCQTVGECAYLGAREQPSPKFRGGAAFNRVSTAASPSREMLRSQIWESGLLERDPPWSTLRSRFFGMTTAGLRSQLGGMSPTLLPMQGSRSFSNWYTWLRRMSRVTKGSVLTGWTFNCNGELTIW